MTSSVVEKINRIEAQLPSHVRLVAVTKQVSIDAMKAAYQAGIRDFGENRLQEAIAKQEQLQDLPDLNWHFIGHIQKNKAKKVMENFDWIHSVDSLSLALRLDKLAADLARTPQVCLQVKPLPDPNKYGWQISELLEDLPQLDRCRRLNIQGLMTILPLGLSSTETLAAFQTIKELATTIEQKNWSNIKMKQLSMGMSEDYQLAIQAGATMIRLGRILFGERKQ